MGIDIGHKYDRKVVRKAPKSDDIYRRMLVKLYSALARKTNSKFNAIIKKRLCMSRINTPPMSIARLVRLMKKEGRADKIGVVVGKITNDVRIYDIPSLKVCALKCSSKARDKIEAAGGEVMTFDELAKKSPTGKQTVLIQARRTAREACKHFGKAPGVPHSHTKPFVRSKGRKFERARGRRKSRAFKV
ncbi:RPL18 [Cordylochernes scorpioides]|uniref:Large ribosomal subunit protein eL18 n=1 Tax=Cordylochernes scorpioides TaxID=51811 RepID=A0ABY6LH75_9ARAC|nr:RPL18 [Cordylochernes scorpioides]